MTGVYKKRRRVTDTEGKGHVKTEGEIGVVLPHAKECLWLSGAGRDNEGSCLEVSEGMQPCQHAEFGFLTCRTERMSFCFKRLNL